MKMHDLDTLFLMTFHEVYLLNYLISYDGISIPMCSNQNSETIEAFIVILCL